MYSMVHVGSKTTFASSSRTMEKEEMISKLNALVALLVSDCMVLRLVVNCAMRSRTCSVMCVHWYVGSQLDEILHRAQNQALISSNLGLQLGEALLGLFFCFVC